MKLFFLLAVLCFLFSISAGHSAEETPPVSEGADDKQGSPKVVFPRRKYIRRRFGAHAKTPSPNAESTGSDGNVTFSVSMSSSVSETQHGSESEEAWKPELKTWRPKKFFPKTKPPRSTTTPPTTLKPSSRTFRPIYPRIKKFTPFEFKKLVTKTTTTTTTPSPATPAPVKLTTRTYKRPVHPRIIFNKNRFSPTTTTGQPAPEPPLTETPNTSFKPKSRPHFLKSSNRPLVKTSLKKLFKPTTESTTIAGREDSVEEAVPELTSTTSTTPTPPAPTTTPEPLTTTSTTTTTTTTTTPTTTSTTTTSTTFPSSNEYVSSSSMEEMPKKDKDMIIIPVPPSQRKPYHPVIMQVTKTPSVSSTERPQTKVVTYKLNKMFVPMGIYGKVLQKSDMENTGSDSGPDLMSTTPSSKHYKGNGSPQIRHKGTSSEELLASSDESSDFATAVRPSDAMTEADEIFSAQEWAPHFQNAKKQRPNKQFMHASEVDLTMNYKPDISTISLTTQRPNINTISLTTTEVSAFNPMGSYKNHNSMTQMGPPRPFDKPSRPSSLVESIKSAAANAASSIPGLIHGGLTQLSQYAPFEDPVFGSTSPSPAPTKSSVTLGAPDVETLEYFRKRPHLIKPTSNYVQQGNHFQPSYSSGGFKPVTAPPHFAKSYYASTTTTPSPSSTTGSSHESSHRPPTGRSPKNVQEIRGSGKKENSKEYVDQLVESSNKYKFSATASPFENDLIRHHWKELNEKYTQEDLQEATSNIYSLFSGPSPPSVEQMLYMKPPGHWSRTSTSAFHDLLKMFRLGFSYGQSSTPVRMHYTTHKPYDSYDSYKPKETYSTGNTLRSSTVSETPDRPPSDGWRPLKSTSTFLKEPFLSFNAAISFRSTPKPTSLYPGHGGSHYSTSSKPFVPGKFTALKGVRGNPYSSTSHGSYVDAALADSYSGSSSKGSGGLLNSPYSVSTISPLHHTTSVGSSYGDGESYLAPSGGSLYNDGDSYGSKGSPLTLESYKPPSNTYSGQASGPAKYVSKPSTPDYSDAYYGNHNSNKDSKVKFEAAHVEETYSPPANFASLYENDPGIELIPSSAYYKAKEAGIISSGEIAAVLKPETMSDDDVKSQLRQDVANIPQITYPNGKVPQQLQTLSQLNEYFQTSEPTSQNHVHFQPPLYRIIQQSMQSQNEQLSGLHQQAGVLLNQPVDSQIQELFKAQEQPSSQAQQYADPGVTSFLGNGNHDIQHHHHQMPTQVQHHHTHHVMPEEREQTYEQLHFQPTQEYNKPEQDKQLHYQPAQFIQQHLPQQNIQELLQQHQLQQQHHQQHQLQQQHHQQQQLQHQQHQLQQHQLQEHQQQLQHQQHQYTLPQHLQPQALHRQPPQQVVHKQPSAAKPQQQSGQSGLSFTDFELPPGVDPDIASLLKAELDKDDIPEEFRKEFENQEKAKQQKDQSVGGSNPKPKVVKPPVQRRADAPKTIFHKPIPISPTLLTPSKRGRPPPPQIPKYVLDLARKLRTDKDLQGIVRVTSKKEGGPPIEYLYPVRG